MTNIRGIVDHFTYQNTENGYSVVKLILDEKKDEHLNEDTFTATGTLFGVDVGETVDLTGEWVMHPKYGIQFHFEKFAVVTDQSLAGMERFLGSGLIAGVGPVTARRIVDRFGEDTFRVLEYEPERLMEVPGIGDKTWRTISESFLEQKEIKDVMVYLQGYDISSRYAVKLYQFYGPETIARLKENPYAAVEEVNGIGFKVADSIAEKMGIEKNSEFRLKAGLKYVLNQLCYQGNSFVTREELFLRAKRALEVTEDESLEAVFTQMAMQRDIIEEDSAVYLPAFFHAERGAAEKLFKLKHTPFFAPDFDRDQVLLDVERDTGLSFSEEQKDAIKASVEEGVLVVTGGPGTGKTTIIRGMIAMYQRLALRIALVAPTGRAAKRMTESTKMEAKTIHRLLEYSYFDEEGMHFGFDAANPLPYDVVIVDEMSMVDVLLFYFLLQALSPGTRLVLVGDTEQLPSIGAGNVLEDIIKSGKIKVVHLKKIFRQAEQSLIVVNAHRVNEGKPPLFLKEARDFFYFEKNGAADIQNLVIELCAKKIPSYFRMDPMDIQVLTPMRKTPLGVIEMNQKLQKVLNPKTEGKPEVQYGNTVFRLHDRVMQMKNNYQKDVFNGDVGKIVDVRPDGGVMVEYVDYTGEKYVLYDNTDLEELSLSYAISVHKSQGSEFRAVVIPLTLQHTVMLQRNLFYTAITRARELVVLVGQREAMKRAILNHHEGKRASRLDRRIIEQFEA